MIQNMTAIWRFRHFLLALVRLDLRLRYRRSILGVGWSLLNPIAMTLTFTVVFSNLLGSSATEYAPYLLAGMTVWNFLKESATVGSRALIANESYIRQSPLPYGVYTLRTILGSAIHTLIALFVLVVLLIVLHRSPAPLLNLTAAAPGLLLMFVAAWAVATIFAYINVYFQDTQHLLEVGSQILFFLTPIMYKRQLLDGKEMTWAVDLNPVNLFLELVRDPILTGNLPAATLFASGTAVTAVLVGLAVGTGAWLHKKVIFHL